MKRKAIKKIYYVYYLRRPDKQDPFYSELWQPFYVGRGCNGRVYTHRWEAKRYVNDPSTTVSNLIKTRVITKLWEEGLDFVEEIMFDNLTSKEADEIEMAAVAHYGRINIGTGCLANLTDGGFTTIGYVFSEESKKKMSEAKQGVYDGENNPFYKHEHTEETKQILREKCPHIPGTMTGKNHSEESILKMCESHKGAIPWNKGLETGPLSEEHRNKISIKNTGKVPWNKGIPDSEETRKRKSEAHSGDKNPMYGKLGEDNPNTGKVRSKEVKEGISKRKKDWWDRKKNEDGGLDFIKSGKDHPMYGLHGEDNPNTGSKRTPEQRANMSRAQKLRFEREKAEKENKEVI